MSGQEQKRMKWIHNHTTVDDITYRVKKIIWRWAEHLDRQEDGRWTKGGVMS